MNAEYRKEFYPPIANLTAAAACMTMGCKYRSSTVVAGKDGRDNTCEFHVDPTGPVGVTAKEIHHDMTKGSDELARGTHEADLLESLTPKQRKQYYKAVTNNIRCFAANRIFLLGIVNDPRNKKIQVCHNGSIALVSANASQETKNTVSKLL